MRIRCGQALHPLVVLAGLSMLAAGTARAEAPTILELAPGLGGPEGPAGGPGNEQPTVATLEHDGERYVVAVYMSSNVASGDGPWQCKCSSVALSPQGEPKIVADQVQLTKNGGARPCNHPKLASDGQRAVWVFGSTREGAATQTYAGVLDPMCRELADPIRISTNAGNNEGAPDIAYNGNGVFTAGYLQQGGAGVSYARGLVLHDQGGIWLEPTYLSQVVTPANIGRPAIVAAKAERSLLCAAKGNERPPEVGVECGWLNAIDGTVYWRRLIASSQPNDGVYFNQPSVALLDYERIAVQVLESSGQGKINDTKGSNVTRLHVIDPSDSGMVDKGYKEALGAWQTHSAICSGGYGEKGNTYVGVLGASITGVGQPMLQMVSYDAGKGLTADTKSDRWIVGYYGDAGALANLYGANPGQQGRDFLRCIGDVPNPGHGVDGGWMPNVETLFAVPHAGRKPGAPKNALFLSFVPGKTDAPVDSDPPGSESGSGPSAVPGVPSSGTPLRMNDEGCACSTEGGAGEIGFVGLSLLAFAAAAAGARRRKGG